MTIAFATGKIIDGRYELESILGSGGFAVVYKAVDKQFNRHVALKILHEGLVVDEEGSARFRQEAQIIGNFRHRNILTCYGMGVDEGLTYSAIEYVNAQTLQEEAEKGKLSWQDLVAIARGIAAGMSYAHQRGVVHRDLTPKNVMVDRSEGACVPRVIDFGLARIIEGSRAQRLTQEGTAVGTAFYSSPEQCMGQSIDARADIYSLGCVLYFCITGAPPFLGDDCLSVFSKHVTHEPIPPIQLNKNVSQSLNNIVLHCLMKDPKDRYQTMKELSVDLENVEIPQGMISTATIKRVVETHYKPVSERGYLKLIAATLAVVFISLGLIASVPTVRGATLSVLDPHGYRVCAAIDDLRNDKDEKQLRRFCDFLIPAYKAFGAPSLGSARVFANASIIDADGNSSRADAERAVHDLANIDLAPLTPDARMRTALDVIDAAYQQPHMSDSRIAEYRKLAMELPGLSPLFVNLLRRTDFYLLYADLPQVCEIDAWLYKAEMQCRSRDAAEEATELRRIIRTLPERSLSRFIPILALGVIDRMQGTARDSENVWFDAAAFIETREEPRAVRYYQALNFDHTTAADIGRAVTVRCDSMGNRPAVDRVCLLQRLSMTPSPTFTTMSPILLAALEDEPTGVDAESIKVMLLLYGGLPLSRDESNALLHMYFPTENDRKLLYRRLVEMAQNDLNHRKFGAASSKVQIMVKAGEEALDPMDYADMDMIAANCALAVGNRTEWERIKMHADSLRRRLQTR